MFLCVCLALFDIKDCYFELHPRLRVAPCCVHRDNKELVLDVAFNYSNAFEPPLQTPGPFQSNSKHV